MTVEDYEKGVLRTWNHEIPVKDQQVNAVMGLAGEAGEFIDALKKMTFHGKDYDKAKLADELGDVLYYVVANCLAHGIPLGDVARGNLIKLAARYPQGFVPGGGKR